MGEERGKIIFFILFLLFSIALFDPPQPALPHHLPLQPVRSGVSFQERLGGVTGAEVCERRKTTDRLDATLSGGFGKEL